jgi:hypothetical protein
MWFRSAARPATLSAMNRWDDLIKTPRAAQLRQLLSRAARTAHVENGERFAPEDLGDDARIYGIATSNSARFLAGRAIEHAQLDGVVVHERGLVWWLEIGRSELAPIRVYFYKAPPAARSVWDLRLDDAEVKRNLSASNGRQLELFSRHGGPGHPDLLNLIVVHYGDPHAGPGQLQVGAPYVTDDDLAWDWHERFDLDDSDEQTVPTQIVPDDRGGFDGLKLVEPVRAEQLPERRPAAAGNEEASNTGEVIGFGGLEMRRAGEEDEQLDESNRTPE